MVDLSGGIGKLPPAERLKRLRELEEEKRRGLEEALTRKKRELKELEQQTEQELEEAAGLERQTREELEEQGQEELEERLEAFRKQRGFVPEEGAEPAGFGQVNLYETEQFQRTEQHIGDLLKGPLTQEEEREKLGDIYQNARMMRERVARGEVDESYAANRLYKEMEALKEHANDEFGYIGRITNVLNSIIDYRQQDEERRKAA